MLRAVAVVVAALVAAPAPSLRAQEPGTVEADVAAGVLRVQEGDFEGAVTTLQAVVARLKDDPQRQRLRLQAQIQLAVAHVALDHTDEAVQALVDALAIDPRLRLGADAYSPKVLRALETARAQVARAAHASGGKSSGKKALLVGAGAAVAATAVTLAATGGDNPAPPAFAGARFGTPALDCPDGSVNLALPFTILVEASNPGSEPLTISSATAAMSIVASPGFPSEVGFRLSRPTTVTPAAVPARLGATIQVESTLVCGNGSGDRARFNDWSGRVTLTTSAGVFVLDTADTLRVNIP